MRRPVLAVCVVGAVGVLAAGVAMAASPVHNTSFSGTGGDYMNQSSSWKRQGNASFSFKTSRDGGRMLHFYGTYSYYCGRGGTTNVHATYLTVGPTGRFDYPFTVRTQSGIVYVEIYGNFESGGTRAKVFYLIDYVPKNQRVAHPYDTGHPKSLGCASWVQGEATAG
jgi:hypothetical protein